MDCLFGAIVAGTKPGYPVLDTPDAVGFLDARPVFRATYWWSPRTHVARIFAKLRLRDRAQAVALAYETGLISPGDPASRA